MKKNNRRQTNKATTAETTDEIKQLAANLLDLLDNDKITNKIHCALIDALGYDTEDFPGSKADMNTPEYIEGWLNRYGSKLFSDGELLAVDIYKVLKNEFLP